MCDHGIIVLFVAILFSEGIPVFTFSNYPEAFIADYCAISEDLIKEERNETSWRQIISDMADVWAYLDLEYLFKCTGSSIDLSPLRHTLLIDL